MVGLQRQLVAVALLVVSIIPLRADERPSMAVFPAIVAESANGQVSEAKLDAQELTRQIEQAVRATRRFSLFERSGQVLRNSVLKEQDFASSGQAVRNAAEAGKLNNVQYIIQPVITLASVTVRKMQWEEKPGQFRYTAIGSIVVSIKVLDTTTAEIMYQTTRQSSLIQGNAIGANQSGPSDEPLVKSSAWSYLSTDVAAKVANAVVGTLFPIQVMRVEGANIYLNRGEGAGVSNGEHYGLYSVGAPLIDPATNEKLGNAEELIGDLEIVRVAPLFSVGRVIGGASSSIKTGDILRPTVP